MARGTSAMMVDAIDTIQMGGIFSESFTRVPNYGVSEVTIRKRPLRMIGSVRRERVRGHNGRCIVYIRRLMIKMKMRLRWRLGYGVWHRKLARGRVDGRSIV